MGGGQELDTKEMMVKKVTGKIDANKIDVAFNRLVDAFTDIIMASATESMKLIMQDAKMIWIEDLKFHIVIDEDVLYEVNLRDAVLESLDGMYITKDLLTESVVFSRLLRELADTVDRVVDPACKGDVVHASGS